MLFLFFIIGSLLINSTYCDNKNIYNELFKRIDSFQVMKPRNYTPPFSWGEKLGLFRSDIHFMLTGGPIQTEVRSNGAIFDNDMFSSGWIITALLESILYGTGAPVLDANRLELALNAINDFQDRNVPNGEVTPLKNFWPQIFNGTYNIWQSQPDNVRQLCLNFDKIPWSSVEFLLKTIGLEKYANDIESFKSLVDISLKAFQIPPDFDDTYLNVGIGSTLKKLQHIYPQAYERWSQNNQNMEILVNYTIKYSYQPFSDDPSKSVIDPRTYFFARPFLLEAKKNNQSVALITTWMQNIDEQRYLADKGVSMPFNLNNVDVTVSANSIYGIASAALYDLNGFQSLFLNSPQLQQIFLNTTKFISWAIRTNYTSRPDLAQVYYPSNYNFLWYASRTLFLLSNELSSSPIDEPLRSILQEAHDSLQDTFENHVTNSLHNKAKHDNDQSELYFDDFLGLNDTNIFGQMKATGEDRLFSTSQAINILIATWTYQDQGTKRLLWKDNTPAIAKYLIDCSVKWLQKNIFNRSLKPLNAFFSGSVKGFGTLPFWFPANFVQYLNGTTVDPANVPQGDFQNIYYGVKGVIDEADYNKMILTPHFGVQTPVDFPGYNTKTNYFPFWSSKAYTYSTALLALAQNDNIFQLSF